jgi:hypothetical protein
MIPVFKDLGAKRLAPGWPPAATNDLQTQLEDLLDQVWESEADWRLNDRIDLSLQQGPR